MKEILEALAAKGCEVMLIHHAGRMDYSTYKMTPQWSCQIKHAEAHDEVKVMRLSPDLETAVQSAVDAFENIANGGLGQALLAAPTTVEGNTPTPPTF